MVAMAVSYFFKVKISSRSLLPLPSFLLLLSLSSTYLATFFSPQPGMVAMAVSHFFKVKISSRSFSTSKSTSSLT
jgi:hypothetical protein